MKRKGEHPKYKQGSAPTITPKAEGDHQSQPKKSRHGGCKGKGKKAYFSEHSFSPNLFTLAAPAIVEQAHLQIAI